VGRRFRLSVRAPIAGGCGGRNPNSSQIGGSSVAEQGWAVFRGNVRDRYFYFPFAYYFLSIFSFSMVGGPLLVVSSLDRERIVFRVRIVCLHFRKLTC
jgi:hypothetical protein